MRPIRYLLCIAISLYIPIFAEEIEEVIVTASFLAESTDSNQLHVIDERELREDATESLGSSLDNLLGISSADYGAAVGQPVIRGMSGNRVKVLNNGIVNRDVSGLGPDHSIEIDMNNVQQIEVIKGPSSLLYANGAIGGIVNVVDNTIARTDISESDLRVGLESQSVNDGQSYDLSYQNNLGGFNVSAAFRDSEFDNFDIPTGAVIHDEEEHEDEHEENLGYLMNSDHEASSKSLGISKVGDWGHIGLSWKNLDSSYGIPFHGEEHGDHDEEHGDDDHDEEHADHDEDSHENERIFASTEVDIINLEGSFNLDNNWVKGINYFFRDTDYLLWEQHAEVEGAHEEEDHDGDHHDEGPTYFTNESTEYGAVFDLSGESLTQKVAINFMQEDLSIVGHESFMNPAENEEMTLGYFVSGKLGDSFRVDFGIRHDRISRKGSVTHRDEHDDHDEEHGDDDHDEEHGDDDHDEEHGDDDHDEEHAEIDYFDHDVNNTSYALTLSREITNSLNASLGLAFVERAPSATELFMNGPHLATARFEVGNPALDSERSQNIDLNFRYQKNGFFANLTFFRNNVTDYIYLLDETEDEHEEHEGEDHEGLVLANYLQQDASLDGYEFEIGTVFELANGDLSVSYGRDSVDGKFDRGGRIPRMIPTRNIYDIAYTTNNFRAALTLKSVDKQSQIAEQETTSERYDMLDLRLTRTFQLNSTSELNVSLFGKNLLDEIARNHTSFVKDEVPLPGRNIGIRINMNF